MKTIKTFALTALMAGAAFTAIPLAANAAGNAQDKFSAADVDSSGTVTQNEFVTYMTTKDTKTSAEATQKFSQLDANKDGNLTLSEMESGWKDHKDTTTKNR
jgi:Ca2+-binding EF-hand superfamily protein